MKINKQVGVADIAKKVPLNTWLGMRAFSELTGIEISSARSRVHVMSKYGEAEKRKSKSGLLEVRITEASKKLMLSKGADNERNRVMRRKDTENIIKQTKVNKCEGILKAAGFM